MNTLHEEISGQIRDRIMDGTYPSGKKIPAIPELMKEFDVARDTVRDAVSRLTNEGLVTPLRGVGTVVRDGSPVALAYRPEQAAAVWSVQAEEAASSDQVVEAGWDWPDKDVASRLDLPPQTQVVYRIRHQSKGGQLAQIMEQWIPAYVATSIREATGVDLADSQAELPTDLFSLMRKAQDAPTVVTETVRTRMPIPDEVSVMALPPGVPVLVTYRITRNGSSIPMETSTFVGAGDRMSQSFTVPLNNG